MLYLPYISIHQVCQACKATQYSQLYLNNSDIHIE